MTTSKGTIFKIARDCKRYSPKQDNKKATVKVAGKHYDKGKSISLSYSLDMYPQTIHDSYRHNEPSTQLSFVDDVQSQSFYVEPFENEEETVQVNYEVVKEDEAMLDKVVNIPDGKEEGGDRSATMSMEETAEGTEEEESGYDAKLSTGASESDDPKEEAQERHQEEKKNYDAKDDEFADDIKAILLGKKVFDPNEKKSVSRNEPTPVEALMPQGTQKKASGHTATDEGGALDPAKNEHKIFEKISQSMRYANAYDLGAIAMEKKFNQIENDIEETELTKITTPFSTGIEDAEVVKEEVQQPIREEVALSKAEVNEKVEATPTAEKYNSEKLLTPENGGRVIATNQLQVGDLVLITTKNAASENKNTAACYAGMYGGEGEIVMAGKNNALERKALNDYITIGQLAVVLRHNAATALAIDPILTKVGKKVELPDQPTALLEIKHTPIGIHSSVCQTLSKKEQDQCSLFSGKVDLGTADNDRFFIPLSLVKVMESTGLRMLDTSISTQAQDETIKAKHNGELKYFGHIKLENK